MLDLKHFDEGAAPTAGGTKKPASELPDANYDFEVKTAKIKVTAKQKTPILTMDLCVMSPGPLEGAEVERPSFITSQESFNVVLSDLGRLGFDTPLWTLANGRPASDEIDKAVKLLPGLRFHGAKKTNGTYHNIYINERMDDGKPATFGPDELNAVPRDPF